MKTLLGSKTESFSARAYRLIARKVFAKRRTREDAFPSRRSGFVSNVFAEPNATEKASKAVSVAVLYLTDSVATRIKDQNSRIFSLNQIFVIFSGDLWFEDRQTYLNLSSSKTLFS